MIWFNVTFVVLNDVANQGNSLSWVPAIEVSVSAARARSSNREFGRSVKDAIWPNAFDWNINVCGAEGMIVSFALKAVLNSSINW